MKLIISGDTPSQKNHRQIIRNPNTGRMMLIAGKAWYKWRSGAEKELRALLSGLGAIKIEYPATVTVTFYRSTKRRYDLDNAYASIADLLVSAEVLEDDNCNMVECVVLRHGGIDKTNPRAEVQINE